MGTAYRKDDNLADRDPITGAPGSEQEAYWRYAHIREPYYHRDYTYKDFAPAYRTGYEAAGRYPGQRFEDVEPELRTEYERVKGASRLTWERAKLAARAAWDRIERAMPGDIDRDGR